MGDVGHGSLAPPVTERLGLLGGTFDPPHVGHLVTAVNVRHALSLDRVLLVVANLPWQKIGSRELTPAEDRLAMAEAAVAGVAGVEASDLEIRRGGPSYTADTLEALLIEDPERQLFVVLGRDAASGLPTWERVGVVRARSTIVVVHRPGSDHLDLPRGYSFTAVDVPHFEVSSTDVRARVADGRPIDFLVPPAVARCISDRHIYRGAR